MTAMGCSADAMSRHRGEDSENGSSEPLGRCGQEGAEEERDEEGEEGGVMASGPGPDSRQSEI